MLYCFKGTFLSNSESYDWADEIDDTSENYAVWCLVARARKKLRAVLDTLDYIKAPGTRRGPCA